MIDQLAAKLEKKENKIINMEKLLIKAVPN
jgi:hypothetical protein